MTTVEISFRCEHCGEKLGKTEDSDNHIMMDKEFHSCYGEQPRTLAYFHEDSIDTVEGVLIEVESINEIKDT